MNKNDRLIHVGKLKGLILFNDPLTNSTLGIREGYSVSELHNHVIASRMSFAVDWRESLDFACPSCKGHFTSVYGKEGHFLLCECPCKHRFKVKWKRFWFNREV